MRAIDIHAQLLYQLPEALRTNAELPSVYLDIPLEEFIAASMKRPALITSRPKTLADKAPSFALSQWRLRSSVLSGTHSANIQQH
jgi:hypothetical protein